MTNLLLGIDIGTTLTKGVVIEPGGRILAEAHRPVRLHAEHPGWAEEDAEQWWANTQEVIRELLDLAGCQGASVAAVGVSGMVPALVLLDAAGQPLRRSIQQNDARTDAEIVELRALVDEERFFAETGGSINQQLIAPKMRWLARHEPEAVAATHTALGSYDFVGYRLTGVLGIERNWALESGMWGLATAAWDDELVALAGLRRDQLPPVRASHEILGHVHASAAAATGLAEGTPVIAGVADHVASAFAAGVSEDGDLLIKFGGAGDVLYASAGALTDRRLFIDHHVIPGRYLLNGCMATSGSLVAWYVDNFCAEDRAAAAATAHSVYAYLDERAKDLPAGSGGLVLLPYFLGEKTPLHDPLARGTLVGLGLHHGREHVFRAVLEAVVYGFRHHVDVLAERGLPVTRVLASDGGAASDLWLQIAADVLGRPVTRVLRHPGSSLGAAFVAGKAIGAFERWDQIAEYVSLDRPIEPRPRQQATYESYYGIYRDLYRQLKELFPRLARAAATAHGGEHGTV